MLSPEAQDTVDALKVPSICGVSGLVVGLAAGAVAGMATGFGLLWVIAILAGAGTSQNQEDDAESKYMNDPNRPRGIIISPNCQCDECKAKRNVK